VSASFAVALLAALLPQAAKEIAAKAAKAKTNFFIFLPFKFKTNLFENGAKLAIFHEKWTSIRNFFCFLTKKAGNYV
jgi:hypothetical protein